MQYQKGDLVYVPQDVLLFGNQRRYRTNRPTTALFIEEDKGFTYKILVGEDVVSVRRNHIYQLEKTYVS
jgi:hypothetical protein